jgi:hypothetical protein
LCFDLQKKLNPIDSMISSHRRRNHQAAAAAVAEEMESVSDLQEQLEEDSIPELCLDSAATAGKFKNSVTNILSKHCSEVKNASDEIVQSAVSISKKKLKDLVQKHNNEIFSFMSRPDRTPSVLGIAESIFRRYNHDIPTIKGNHPNMVIRDLNLDASLQDVVAEFDEGLLKQKTEQENSLQSFMKQLRWMFQQYKQVGEDVLRLETVLYQKLDHLDKLQQRVPLFGNLVPNDVLPELIDTFAKYAESVYQTTHIEEDYKQLVEAYKKWNICRQIVSLQAILKNDTHEPQCSICLVEPVSFVIVPCGHTFCSTCSKKQNTTCYICRGAIRERVKLYFT